MLDLIKKNPSVKQTELAEQTGKSVRSIKRIIDSLKEKQYIRRVDGKRYGNRHLQHQPDFWHQTDIDFDQLFSDIFLLKTAPLVRILKLWII